MRVLGNLSGFLLTNEANSLVWGSSVFPFLMETIDVLPLLIGIGLAPHDPVFESSTVLQRDNLTTKQQGARRRCMRIFASAVRHRMLES